MPEPPFAVHCIMVSTFKKNDSWEAATGAEQDFVARLVSPADNFTNQSIYILEKSFYILFVVFELDFECGGSTIYS